MSEKTSWQRFANCPHCDGGELRVRLGFVAQPPTESTEIFIVDGDWKSARLQVHPSLIAYCTNAPQHCTMAEVAAIGIDALGRHVAPEPGTVIRKFLTDPDLLVLSDEQVEAMYRDNEDLR